MTTTITDAQHEALARVTRHDSVYMQKRTKALLFSGDYHQVGNGAWIVNGHKVSAPGCDCDGWAFYGRCSHYRTRQVITDGQPVAVSEVIEMDPYEDDGQPFDPSRDYRAETARRRQDNQDRQRIAAKHERATRCDWAFSDIDRLALAA